MTWKGLFILCSLILMSSGIIAGSANKIIGDFKEKRGWKK